MNKSKPLGMGTLLSFLIVATAASLPGALSAQTILSNFDSASASECCITDGDVVWSSTDASTLSLSSSAYVGMGSGQVLSQAAEMFEGSSALVGHFWADFSALGIDRLVLGDKVTVSFTMKFESPADPDNPGYDRYRFGIFEGATANSYGVGNTLAPGSGVGNYKNSFFKEAYNEDESPKYFTKEDLYRNSDVVAGGDTPSPADDLTINGYIGNGEAHDYTITITKVTEGVEYHLDLDNGAVAYTYVIPSVKHNFNGFKSFQFYMRDATSPDMARGLSIDDFMVEFTPAELPQVADTFDTATVVDDGIEGDLGWTSSSSSNLSLTSEAGIGSGQALMQSGESFDSGMVGHFFVDISSLGIEHFKLGESVIVSFQMQFPGPGDADNPGYDRYRFGIFEGPSANSYGVGNTLSPGTSVGNYKVSCFKESYNEDGTDKFFNKDDVYKNADVVQGGDTPSPADDVTINGYINDGAGHHYMLVLTKTPGGIHYSFSLDDGAVAYDAMVPASLHNFTKFNSFQFYMRSATSANDSKELYIDDFSVLYAQAEAADGPVTLVSDFDMASEDEETENVTDKQLFWQSIENATLTLVGASDAGMGDSGNVLAQLNETFEEEPAGIFGTSLADLGATNLQEGDNVEISFKIKLPTPADADNPGYDRIRFGIFEQMSTNSYGLGYTFASGADPSRLKISFFKEGYGDDGSPNLFSKDDLYNEGTYLAGEDTPSPADDITLQEYLSDGDTHTIVMSYTKLPTGLKMVSSIDDIASFEALASADDHEFEALTAFWFYMRAPSAPTDALDVYIDDFTATYTSIDDMPLTPFDLYVDAFPTGGGKLESPWFGAYSYIEEEGHIMHYALGDLFVGAVQQGTELWLFSMALNQWLWINDSLFPYIYTADGAWRYMIYLGEDYGTWLFNYNTSEWLRL